MKEEEKCDPRDKRSPTLHPFTSVKLQGYLYYSLYMRACVCVCVCDYSRAQIFVIVSRLTRDTVVIRADEALVTRKDVTGSEVTNAALAWG